MSKLTLNISLLSDWRIGSGTGRPGDIDHLIRRDRDQLPFLPGKTLTGILRDGCELAALALDEGLSADAPRWRDWVDYLFGTQPNQDQSPSTAPTPAHFAIQSAHLPQAIRTAISGKPLLQTALTFVKPGIKINAKSGSVEEKCFRLEEMARGNIQLRADCQLAELTAEEQNLAKALLAAGAALSERVGGKRRRGAGHCRIGITGYSLQTAHDYLAATPQPLAVPTTNLEQAAGQTVAAAPSTAWHSLPLTVTTEQPVIVAKATIGNVIQTQDYVPASYLLPIIARHLAGWDVDLSAAIAQNAFVITNAYPSEGSQTSAPMPFALFKEKAQEKGPAYNRLKDTEKRPQLKQCRKGYISPEGDGYRSTLLSTGIETHNTVSDPTQRPESDVGGVYSYQAIPANTQLQAELRINAALWHELSQAARLEGENRSWWKCLAGTHNLGRSRKDEYGKVELTLPEREPQSVEIATTSDDKTLNFSDVLTVWCLSDILLRDKWLRPSVDPQVLAQKLSEVLDIENSPLTVIPFKAGAASQFARHNRTESWQTRWGLARPSFVGIQAGSCFTFAVPEGVTVTQAQLQALEYSGIGERRVEGFGQIRLNHPLLEATQLQLQSPDSKAQRQEKPTAPSHSNSSLIPSSNKLTHDYARTVELEAWRTAIRRIAMAIADDPNERSRLLGFQFDPKEQKSTPSLTQLGGLRSQLMQLHKTADQEKNNVQRWLKSLSDAQKWTGSASKVMDYVANRNQIWTTLDFSRYLKVERQAMLLTQGGEQAIKDELWAEAVETFLSACIRAHKRDAEAQQSKEKQVKAKPKQVQEV